jgi:hypothetical protein
MKEDLLWGAILFTLEGLDLNADGQAHWLRNLATCCNLEAELRLRKGEANGDKKSSGEKRPA